jgi:Ca2+-binding EF-hand superfamily protein
VRRQVLWELFGREMNQEEVEPLLAELDVDGDGQVSLEELLVRACVGQAR